MQLHLVSLRYWLHRAWRSKVSVVFAKYTETYAASAGAVYPGKLSGNGREISYGVGLKAGLHRKLGKHFSLGSHWDFNDGWTLRAGFSFGDQPVTYYENTFNIPVISLTEAHYTFGASYRLANGDELSFSFMYTEEESLEELNQLDPSQVVRITTDQFDLQISYSWQQ